MTLRSRWCDLVHRLDLVADRPADPAALTGRSAYRRDERPVALPADEHRIGKTAPRVADARAANPDLADIRADQRRRMRGGRPAGEGE